MEPSNARPVLLIFFLRLVLVEPISDEYIGRDQ